MYSGTPILTVVCQKLSNRKAFCVRFGGRWFISLISRRVKTEVSRFNVFRKLASVRAPLPRVSA